MGAAPIFWRLYEFATARHKRQFIVGALRPLQGSQDRQLGIAAVCDQHPTGIVRDAELGPCRFDD
jgi:hypothetical protein